VFDDPPFCVGRDQVDLPAAFECILENTFFDDDLSDLLKVCVGGDNVDLPSSSGGKVVEPTCNDDVPGDVTAAANFDVFDDPPVCVGGDNVDLPAASDDKLVEPTCNDDVPGDVIAAANFDVFDDPPVCVGGDVDLPAASGDNVVGPTAMMTTQVTYLCSMIHHSVSVETRSTYLQHLNVY